MASKKDVRTVAGQKKKEFLDKGRAPTNGTTVRDAIDELSKDRFARLRDSKLAWEINEKLRGQTAGEEWAVNEAEWEDLLVLEELRSDIENDGYVSGLHVEEKLGYENLWNVYGDDNNQVSDYFATGFVEGALRAKDEAPKTR